MVGNLACLLKGTKNKEKSENKRWNTIEEEMQNGGQYGLSL
jgi:hypothetical protein